MTGTSELLQRWAGIGPDALEAQLTSPDSAPLEALFDDQELAEMREIAAAPRITSATGQRPNIVLLPGVMGSLLQSVEGLIDSLWINPLIFARGHINLLDMAEDGQGDADPRVRIVATGLEMVAYGKAILALRKQANLYLFPYDWRQDIRVCADRLHEAFDDTGCLAVIEKAEPEQQAAFLMILDSIMRKSF